MSELDDLLQKKLEAIERRLSSRKTPKGLAAEAGELDALIHLAANLRSMPHPQLEAESSRLMQQKLIETAKLTLRPQKRSNPFDLSWLLKPGLAGLTMVFIAVLVIVISGVWVSGPSVARTATLRDMVGQVQVADRSGADWKTVADGTLLSAGQQVRTLDGSSATLQFFDGTRTALSANTGLVLSEVAGGWRTELQVKLMQQYGLTSHEVVSLVGEKSHFVVDTPAGSAAVHGTAFSVAVDPQGTSYFSVETGGVEVENPLGLVALQSGQATIALPSQAPLPPAFTFTLQDTLTVQTDGSLGLANSSFEITGSTFSVAGLQPGTSVQVTGRILENGEWVVDILQPSGDETGKFAFMGEVEEMSPESWTVSGIPVQIDPATKWDGAIQLGDTVEVKVVILGSGGWRALEILGVIEPIPATTDQEAIATQEPSKIQEGSEALTPGNCTGTDPHPEALTLAGRYHVTSDAIMGWFCQGFGFGEIDLVYNLSAELEVDVAEIFAMRADGQGWGEIEQFFDLQPVNENKPPTKTPKPANENQPDREVKPSKTPRP